MKEDPDTASAVAAIWTLLEFLKRDKGKQGHLPALWALGKSSNKFEKCRKWETYGASIM